MTQTENDFYNGINELLGYSLPGSVQSLSINMDYTEGVSITATFYPFRDELPDSRELVTKTFELVEKNSKNSELERLIDYE